MKTYVDYFFSLSNGQTKKVTIKDVRENVEESALSALADLIIGKNCIIGGSQITKVISCSKYNVEETKII